MPPTVSICTCIHLGPIMFYVNKVFGSIPSVYIQIRSLLRGMRPLDMNH